jgi:NAD(P)-dependent dehydrogenase (short-subunit alcohol dehydrogenase family)
MSGSIASRKPLVDVTVYCTSKYGCLALTHCGALALAEHNITVNGYAPGVVVTPLWEQLDKDLVEIGFKEREGQAYDDIVDANNAGHQARVLSRRHHRHGVVPRQRRQRLHDRPDDP